MVALVSTVAYLGLEARAVEVQVQLSSGVPRFVIVGLADKAVAESRERVRGALSAIGLALPPKIITVNLSPADLPKEGSHFDLPIALGLSLPPKRITVNLSPADLPKEGSHYDLPIALAVLGAMGIVDAETLSGYVVVGELGLNGRIDDRVDLGREPASGATETMISTPLFRVAACWCARMEVLSIIWISPS